MSRIQVLQLYRKLIKLSKSWNSKSKIESETRKEREYIYIETRRLFKSNNGLTDPKEIQNCINEGESRIEICYHYGIPYPRLPNFPQSILPPSKHGKTTKQSKRALEESIPSYMGSYLDEYINKK